MPACPLRSPAVTRPAPTLFTLAARLPGPPGRQCGKRWVHAPSTAQAAPTIANVLREQGERAGGRGEVGAGCRAADAGRAERNRLTGAAWPAPVPLLSCAAASAPPATLQLQTAASSQSAPHLAVSRESSSVAAAQPSHTLISTAARSHSSAALGGSCCRGSPALNCVANCWCCGARGTPSAGAAPRPAAAGSGSGAAAGVAAGAAAGAPAAAGTVKDGGDARWLEGAAPAKQQECRGCVAR